MTKGQLLAMDTPQNIKEQFGEGYKIMIEPKTEVITMEEFGTMKEQIDNVLFNGDNAIPGMIES